MQKHNMEDMYYTILAYRNATEVIYNNLYCRSLNNVQTSPYAKVCLSSLCLTLELSLKYLMIMRGKEIIKGRDGHDLSLLFNNLTEEDKKLLEDLWSKACLAQALPQEERAFFYATDKESANKQFEMAKKRYNLDTAPDLSNVEGFLSYVDLRNWTKSYYSWDDIDRPFSFFSDMRIFLEFLHLLSLELKTRSAKWWTN